jgi:hypothetical protein
MTRLLSFICTLTFLAAVSSPADATTVEERSLRAVVEEAHSIVHGTVISTSSRWTENRSMIVTDVRIEVHDVLKGDPAAEVVVTQPGGKVGRLRVEADGASAFRAGDETILFLRRGKQGRSHVVGLFQGHFRVETDRRGNKMVKGLSPEHVEVVSGSLRPLSAPGPASPAPVPLNRFLGDVRDLVRDTANEGGR